MKMDIGDIVHARVRIVSKPNNGDYVTVVPAHWEHGLKAEKGFIINNTDVLKVEERPLAVGDKVLGNNWHRRACPGVIIAIDMGYAWVKVTDADGERLGTYSLLTLERVS